MGITKRRENKKTKKQKKETHATNGSVSLAVVVAAAVIFRSSAPLIRIRPLHDRSLIIVKGFVYDHPMRTTSPVTHTTDRKFN